MISPSPWQSGHTVCVCVMMPGPIWRMRTCTPWPRHALQFFTAPSLPPRPSHLEQMTFLFTFSLRVVPLYVSSMLTCIW